jgi:hypothetical protein
MEDKIDRIFDFLEGAFLHGCLLIMAIVAIAAPISMIMQWQESEKGSAQVIKFENFCHPEWKDLEKYGARVNCYQE